jgi:PadR family transcriptional regulator, regulatory protein PadR
MAARQHPRSLTSLEVHVLLAAVALHPRAYGNAIVVHIGKFGGYDPLKASVYIALAGLAKKGFLRPRDGKPRPVQGGRRIRYWTVTPAGKRALTVSIKVTAALSRSANFAKNF